MHFEKLLMPMQSNSCIIWRRTLEEMVFKSFDVVKLLRIKFCFKMDKISTSSSGFWCTSL